ncbi:MAG: GDSL-type esterase/lipase family protein [Candidatus Hinthialibacter antarcticus]|nr:GDSL-type esterase/lipase family protein [Candidatus Hinthialibacter antarcticus]
MYRRLPFVLFLLALVISVDFCLRIFLFDAAPPVHPPTLEQYVDFLAPQQVGALNPNLPLLTTSESTLNHFGMRAGEVQIKKSPDIVRIALMGDSTTYGWGVSQDKTFAAQLGALLNQDDGPKVETLNFGAPGFTSYQTLKQYEWLVHNFDPDVLVLAFGLYDGFEARVSDAEWYAPLEQAGTGKQPGLLDRFSALVHWRNTRKQNAALQQVQSLYTTRLQSDEWVERVSNDEMTANLSAIIQHHKQDGGSVILANLNLLNYRTEKPLQTLAQDMGAAYMDARSMFDNVGGRSERERAANLNVAPAKRTETAFNETPRVTFRLYAPPGKFKVKGFSIVGPNDWLGGGVPGRVQLYDDGTHGDERPLDSVWTLTTDSPPARPIDYAFTPTLKEGAWSDQKNDALNDEKNHAFYYRLPEIHWANAVNERTVIHEFGAAPFEEFLLPDTEALPNAQGHAAIARRLASVIQQHALPAQNVITRKE